MVEDLLFLARSDSQTVPLETRNTDAASFLEGVASRARMLARERETTLEVHLHGKGELRVDPHRIEQAIMVLIDNAFKYGTRRGGEQEPVVLSSANEDGELRVSVSDHGPGIPDVRNSTGSSSASTGSTRPARASWAEPAWGFR